MPFTILLLGASGATGRLVAQRLLEHDVTVHVMAPVRGVRQDYAFLDDRVQLLEQTTALAMSDAELDELLSKADCVISCLGHNLSFWGLVGDNLMVTRTVQRLAERGAKKIVLMNTVGARRPGEASTWLESGVLFLLRHTITPHVDNERAMDAALAGKAPAVVVRPDSLVDEPNVSEYTIAEHPPRDIFSGLPTSRINVADFMARLALDDKLFLSHAGSAPCITNKV